MRTGVRWQAGSTAGHLDPDDDRLAGPAFGADQPAMLVHRDAQTTCGRGTAILDEDPDGARVRFLVAREHARVAVHPSSADAELHGRTTPGVVPPRRVAAAHDHNAVAAPAVGHV